MTLFAGTAEYYRRYRPGIPGDVAAVLDAAVTRRPPRRLLDLCTGTGAVVRALIGRFDDVIAVDVDPEMLAVADMLLGQRPEPATLTLQQGRAENFVPPPGWRADLVTIGRAFHWLDRSAVLARLDKVVRPEGAVAILGEVSFWAVTGGWKAAVRSVIQEFLGEARRAGSGLFSEQSQSAREVLQQSPFRQVEEIALPVRRTWTSDTILGYLYSTSFAARRLFGDRLASFDCAVRQRLSEFGNDDTFLEECDFLIQLARRPRMGSP
jgi:ubiquinone/menaquinone biosynthesis C-methylase UbiE